VIVFQTRPFGSILPLRAVGCQRLSILSSGPFFRPPPRPYMYTASPSLLPGHRRFLETSFSPLAPLEPRKQHIGSPQNSSRVFPEKMLLSFFHSPPGSASAIHDPCPARFSFMAPTAAATPPFSRPHCLSPRSIDFRSGSKLLSSLFYRNS